MSKHRRRLELTDDSNLENLAHRQIRSLLEDNKHEYELYYLPHDRYCIVIKNTLQYDYLAESAREARDNARESNMNSEMIGAIKVLRHKLNNHVTASDIWMIERIVREACKKQRRSGSASS